MTDVATASEAPVVGAIYLRQSQDRTGEETAVTRQREDCRALAARRGLDVRCEIVDNDTSASGRKPRPGFAELIRLVESGAISAVIAWNLDRLTRNRRDTLRLIEAGKAAGLTIMLARGSDMDMSTPGGRLGADVLASVAQHEIDQKSDRQRRAQAQAAKEGRRVGGRRPFGFEPDGMTVREHEAAAVRDGYRQLLAGAPLSEISRGWNAAGHLTGQGNPWRRDAVRDVLLNPRNAGLRGYAQIPDNGRRTVEVVGPARWPGLVDQSTWLAVKDLLTDPGRRTAPANARALLSGVALCGVCGATVHAGGATRGQGRVYRCSAAGGHVGRRAEPVEDYVQAVIVARLSRDDARELLTDHDRADVDALRTEAMVLRHRLDSIATEFADGSLTAQQLRVATERVRAHLADVEAQMADAGSVDILGPLVSADDVQTAWGALSVARRRAVIDLLAEVVIYPAGRGVRTFRPDSVGIRWRT